MELRCEWDETVFIIEIHHWTSEDEWFLSYLVVHSVSEILKESDEREIRLRLVLLL